MGRFEFRVLGATEVLRDGEPLRFRGSRERALLALLVVHANRTVSSDRLVADLWGTATPPGATRALRVHVSRVRQALGEAGGLLVTDGAGYLLRTEPLTIDAVRFDALVHTGREQADAGDHEHASATLRAALALWRGPALADIADSVAAAAEAARLEEARLVALEERLDADLACGRHREVVAELDALTRSHPLRERLWAQRITALYRTGRQADALQAYRDLRRSLAEQLGIDPSPELARLETAVLRHDPEVGWRPSEEPPSARPAPTSPAPAAGPGLLPAPLGREERAPLVGRSGQMAVLDAAWEQARAGRCRLVLLAGEPGIGKSRLMAEFARRVHTEAAAVLFGRCDEAMGVPYQPFVDALGRYLRDGSGCVPPAPPAPPPSVPLVLGRSAGELARLVPEVAEHAEGRPAPARADPETERYRLFEAVAAWLGALSAGRPLLFALDDLHWATEPTLLLLSHLVRSEEARSLLLVATYRDNPLDMTTQLADVVAELLRLPGVERVRLPGLDEGALGALVEAQAGRRLDDEGRGFVRVLHTQTAGNPFFVRELLRHLTEKGTLVRRDGRWLADGPVNAVDVPDTVREVVHRRLARLPDRTGDVLSAGAVLGEHVELAVLARMRQEPPAAVVAALAPAVAARLVDETAVGGYQFAHALVRSTLVDYLGPTRRAQLHLRAAEALESAGVGRAEGRAAVLAAHYQQAGSLAAP